MAEKPTTPTGSGPALYTILVGPEKGATYHKDEHERWFLVQQPTPDESKMNEGLRSRDHT